VCSAICIPNSTFNRHQRSQGYDAYDLVILANLHPGQVLSGILSQWDLGEFHQKGTTRTRWGSMDELVRAISVAKQHGIDVLIDAVMNVSLLSA